MKSIVLYYFSGTGNTKKVINLLKDEFEAKSYLVTLNSVESQLKENKRLNFDKYEYIGIAYPIYGFGTPSLIDQLVDLFPNGAGNSLFFLKTGADYISINHNASTEIIEKLEKKNFNVFYDRIIVMPCNWILKYDDRFTKQLYKCTGDKVKHMCSEILTLKRRRYKTGSLIRILSMGIFYLEKKYGSAYFGKSLRVNNKCTHCNLCIEICPKENISLVEETPVFGDQCLWCMRCIYSCPAKAIESKGMNFCIIKEGYDIGRVLSDNNIGSEFVTKNTKGYFKHFIKYLSDESM